MAAIKTIKLFLASSCELEEDREQFERFIHRINDQLIETDQLRIQLIVEENFLDCISRHQVREEYNDTIVECDLFVMFFFTKVGKYTTKEFEIAFGPFRENNTPRVFTYFKNAPINSGNLNRKDTLALLDFQDKLQELGYQQSKYTGFEDLSEQFTMQLKELKEEGFFHGVVAGNGHPKERNITLENMKDSWKRILRYFSILPSEPIKLKHLKKMFAQISPDEQIFEENLNRLVQEGWLSRKEKNGLITYTMHTLLQTIVFQKLNVNDENCESLIHSIKIIMQEDLNLASHYLNYAQSIIDKLLPTRGESSLLGFHLSDTYKSLGKLPEALNAMKFAKTGFELVGDRTKLAIAYDRLGDIHQDMGDLGKALQLFDLRVKLAKKLLDDNPNSENLKLGLAIAYERSGRIHQAMGQFETALRYFELRTELGEELHSANSENKEFKNWLAISYERLGLIHQAMGEFKTALQYFESRAKLGKELHAVHPESQELKNGLATSYERLGGIHQEMEQFETALRYYEQRSELAMELHDENPKSEKLKHGLATSYSKLGDIHQSLERFDIAQGFFELFNQSMTELYEANPRSEALKQGLAVSYEKLGDLHLSLEHFEMARQAFEVKSKLSRELYENSPKNELLKYGLAVSYEKTGDLHQAFKQFEVASRFFESFNRFMQELHEKNPKSIRLKNGLATSCYKLAAIYQETEKPGTDKLAKQAATIREELHQQTKLNQYEKQIEQANQLLE